MKKYKCPKCGDEIEALAGCEVACGKCHVMMHEQKRNNSKKQ